MIIVSKVHNNKITVVNLREHISRMLLISAKKAAHSGFEPQRRRHQKSKRGVSLGPQKDLYPPKNKKKLSNITKRVC